MSSMSAVPLFLQAPPHHLFFTAKSGVGKTSLACASAVSLADAERQVLIVSVDSASTPDAVLGTALTNTPVQVSGLVNPYRVALIQFEAEEPVGIEPLLALATPAGS